MSDLKDNDIQSFSRTLMKALAKVIRLRLGSYEFLHQLR